MAEADHHRAPAARFWGRGACAELIRSIDWSTTPLGPVSGWPAALTATVGNILHSRQPMLLFWGPDLIQFYNDTFVPSFGRGKHPAAMGQRASECWEEAWPVVGAQIEAVMSRGEPAWYEDALVPIFRNGRMEEVFWTYSYSPALDDDGGIAGTLVIVTETTGRVVAARRLAALSALGAELSSATSLDAVIDGLERTVAAQPEDLPFAMVHEQRGTAAAAVVRAIGVDPARAPAAELVTRPQPAAGGGVIELDDGVASRVWPEPITRMFVAALPAPHAAMTRSVAFALSPRLPFDDGYRGYLAQIIEQVAAASRRVDNANTTRAIRQQRDSLLMQAPVATALLFGPTHIFHLANPRYCQIVGRDPTGKAYLEAFPHLAETPVPGVLDRVYQTGEPWVANEAHIRLDRTGTGALEDCYFNFNLEPLRDHDGSVYGMMAVAVDITEQVRARHALEQVDAERRAVLEQLEQASSAKDEFLAMLGHELRNPLAPIASAIELMKHKDSATAKERATIERQLHHVIRLVDDLLDASRITRGSIELHRRAVDLHAVIANAVEIAEPLIEQRGHHLTLDVRDGVFVDGDKARLTQVVANLLTNAARYTPPGGDIAISVTADDGRAIVRVRDTGIGMAPELVARVFDLFVQGKRTPDRAEGGLGIGLALVKTIVALHGGEVTARSAGPGTGSELTVSLPLASPPAGAEPTAHAPALAPARSVKRVLIVDDNEDAAVLLGELVRSCGHEIVIAHDPATALRAVPEFAPDVAILDIGLPDMDGYALAARVRELSAGCRLIALTGYGQDRDRERSALAGFDAHVVKPVAIQAFLQLLDPPLAAAPA
jgi:signal transduction histidine kinase